MGNTEPGKESRPKPNLRQVGPSGSKKFIIVACLMSALSMYPMILKPLFGGGSDQLDEKQLENSLEELRKHRPSNMPDWSSPFGPSKRDKE